MRFEPRRAFRRSGRFRAAGSRTSPDLPPDLAFLECSVSRAILLEAAARGRRENVGGARALLAGGGVSETLLFIALSRHLGVPFVADWPYPATPIDPSAALAAGRVKLVGDPRARWLMAPLDEDLRILLTVRAKGGRMPSIAIVTPSHLSALVRHHGRAALARAASLALPDAAPWLSARDAFDRHAKAVTALIAVASLGASFLDARPLAIGLSAVFLSGIAFRLLVCAGGVATDPVRDALASDADAPDYSVLVPLKDEAAMVPDLLAALGRLDYPRSKLEVLFLLEDEDRETHAALRAARLPPGFRIVVVPKGVPCTKPRALNAGLQLARGALVTVYDAEDRPEPDQLRRAAGRFARPDATLACLQARLAISNGSRSLLASLFAIEYAALFDVLNVGLARAGLPIALGGTSNHFRASALRAAGGWDAWNVTEDADLGLRLARFGYRVEVLDSTTWEAAQEGLAGWFKQRRRWTKGWMQTALVLARGAPHAARDYGPAHTGAVTLMLVNLVVGPLLSPFCFALVLLDLARRGLPTPRDRLSMIEATLWSSVVVAGIFSTLWYGEAGLRARRIASLRSRLPLLLPYQMLISAAAWAGLYDLVRKPYHWHKSRHDVTDALVPRRQPADPAQVVCEGSTRSRREPCATRTRDVSASRCGP